MPPATRSTARPKTTELTALRWVDSGALPPALNMAIDEALLRGQGPPTLRTYGWSPPGLSLGYFQRAADFAAVPGDHVVVRRLTGGGAIYHDAEITFSLAVDLELLPAGIPASYRLIHAGVAAALREVGVPCTAFEEAAPEHGPRPREPWCMAAPAAHDLVTPAGRKLVGSAQRRIRAPRPRLLHHGSLVLAPPAATPGCGSVAEHVDPGSVAARLRRALATRLAAALGLQPQPGELTAAEEAQARCLARERYGAPEFTHRR